MIALRALKKLLVAPFEAPPMPALLGGYRHAVVAAGRGEAFRLALLPDAGVRGALLLTRFAATRIEAGALLPLRVRVVGAAEGAPRGGYRIQVWQRQPDGNLLPCAVAKQQGALKNLLQNKTVRSATGTAEFLCLLPVPCAAYGPEYAFSVLDGTPRTGAAVPYTKVTQTVDGGRTAAALEVSLAGMSASSPLHRLLRVFGLERKVLSVLVECQN